MPGKICAADAHGINPAAKPAGHVRDRDVLAESRQVNDVEPPFCAQQIDERQPPSPRPREPVDENEGLAAARHAVPGRPAVDRRLADLHHSKLSILPSRSASDRNAVRLGSAGP
jgi:hypothetical protein